RHVLREQHANMTTEEYVRLRESGAYSQIEDIMRAIPDGADWREEDKKLDAASRKLISKTIAQAWYEGKISEEDALETLRNTCRIGEGEGLDGVFTPEQATLIEAAIDIIQPEEGRPGIVSYEPPEEKRLPEEINDSQMAWGAREFARPNSPAARQ